MLEAIYGMIVYDTAKVFMSENKVTFEEGVELAIRDLIVAVPELDDEGVKEVLVRVANNIYKEEGGIQ